MTLACYPIYSVVILYSGLICQICYDIWLCFRWCKTVKWEI